MKRLMIFIFLLWLSTGNVFANPSNSSDVEQQLLERISTDTINQFIKGANQELNGDIPLLNSTTIQDIATKGLEFNWQSIWARVTSSLCKELVANTHLLGKLLFLAVLCAMLQNLQNSFCD